ncbi:MAG TPA: hypothetical protein VGH02_07075 [Rhizomicrobium sp.]|jgi:hypothetical protein
MHIVMPALFILAWIGAASSWVVAAYSTLHIWSDGSVAMAGRYRARTFKAAAFSATFIVMGLIAGAADGLFTHLHV